MINSLKTKYDPIARIWSGANRETNPDVNLSIGQIIYNNLQSNPKNICQISVADGINATNQDILSWSVRLAQNFKQRRLRHDDVICIAAKNSTYVTPAAVACLFNATPFHGVSPSLDINTLTHVLTITEPKIIFCDAVDYEKFKTASSAWYPELITITGKVEGVTYVEDLLSPTKTKMFYQPQPLLLGGDQTMIILCSSGTTGQPKAVCLANCMLISGSLVLNTKPVAFCGAGLDWGTGMYYFLRSVANCCTRIIPDKPFSAENLLELIDRYSINDISCHPHHVAALLACPQTTSERLSTMSACVITGSWIRAEALKKMQSLVKNGIVLHVYGATEFGIVSGNAYSDKLGNSVGKLVPGIKMRIVDENGMNLGVREVGEVYVHHGRKWAGYYGNPLETQRMQDSQGWFHTGDLGYFDENGNLYIVDRKKEICKFCSMHYSPNEIEAVIAELPDVQEVCVVGAYDERYGDAPAAMIVKRPESTLSADQIKQHAEKRIPAEYGQLQGGVHFTNKLPTNANGKVLRRVVRDQITQSNTDR